MRRCNVVQLQGGLGNQLFQVAFAESLVTKLERQIVLDSSWYSRERVGRNLYQLPLDSRISYQTFSQVGGFLHKKVTSSLMKPQTFYKGLGFSVVTQKTFSYENFNISHEPTFFSGTFASPKYWPLGLLPTCKRIKKYLSNYLDREPTKTFQSNVLSIHVRRGDLITNLKARKFHGFCTNNYFVQSIDLIDSMNIDIKRIQIASDDIEAAQLLAHHLAIRKVPIEIIVDSNPISVMFKLSDSEFFIGSNSTFSWWAAYLDQKALMIFPDNWFAEPAFDFPKEDLFDGNVHFIQGEVPR
jgi:hypothetical protein